MDAQVGLQPYFYLNSGSVDAEVPVDVVFTAPRQVANGETFTIGSANTIDGGATFETASPKVRFGLDFVLDIVAEVGLNIAGPTASSSISTPATRPRSPAAREPPASTSSTSPPTISNTGSNWATTERSI